MTRQIIRAKDGFTLTELVICMGIMLLVVYFSMSSHIGDQTGKQEAERLEIWLARITQQAIRMKRVFDIKVDSSKTKLTLEWRDNKKKENFEATPGCTFSYNRSQITYNPSNDGFTAGTNGHFTVNGNDQDKSVYYVILSTTGRIRLSDTPPDKDE